LNRRAPTFFNAWQNPMKRPRIFLALGFSLIAHAVRADEPDKPLIRSTASGRWSAPATWERGKVPTSGDRVQIRTEHDVVFDSSASAPIRSIHIAGTLRFDPDRETRLDVGLIKIQSGDDASESGFDCEIHVSAPDGHAAQPALLVGTADRPIASGHTALIRLTAVPGLNPEECPAIVDCGGRMEFHGAPVGKTWVKLGAMADKGDSRITPSEPVAGWKPGDHIIVTATRRSRTRQERGVPTVRGNGETEDRIIESIDGNQITLARPLEFRHIADGAYRGEIANLSRNVIVESADPAGARGHTMYHKYSKGSISYAEFRHLGKSGKLGKYAMHFHRVGDTMRGASVIGASIWDSGNRWITIHGTNNLVVRDCIGFQSIGHGFFLEDGTEVDNILDGNLAVQAGEGSPLEGQALAFDRNEGAGFWWANSHNAFLRNVAVECDQYGFRYEAPAISGFDPVLPVRGDDGTIRQVDIRTLPFIKFDGNEVHSQRRYGLNLGGGPGDGAKGGVGGIGPDSHHPYFIHALLAWECRWGLTPAAPAVALDSVRIAHCETGLWQPRYDRHSYAKIQIFQTRWAFLGEVGTRPKRDSGLAPLEPVDDAAPVTVVTYVGNTPEGRTLVRGVSVDDGTVRSVTVNGHNAQPLVPDFSQWEIVLDTAAASTGKLEALATDSKGNVEKRPQRMAIPVP
jgi:hypothetical protein